MTNKAAKGLLEPTITETTYRFDIDELQHPILVRIKTNAQGLRVFNINRSQDNAGNALSICTKGLLELDKIIAFLVAKYGTK